MLEPEHYEPLFEFLRNNLLCAGTVFQAFGKRNLVRPTTSAAAFSALRRRARLGVWLTRAFASSLAASPALLRRLRLGHWRQPQALAR